MYSKDLIQPVRPRAMYDNEIHTVEKQQYIRDYNQSVEELTIEFKQKIDRWINSHQRIRFYGLDKFTDRNVILGVTQQLDELHMQYKNRIAVFQGDYKYHWRLDPNVRCRTIDTLAHDDVLVLSVPFPGIGDMHPQTLEILNRCKDLNIPVHIDGAWFGCSRKISLNCDHPAIQTVSISLSKALGMGVHRIGLRYAKDPQQGPVKIMNDFSYTNIADMWMGIKMIDKFGADFWWNKYENHYNRICADFNLKPANAIHVAWDGDTLVGIRQLLRYLQEGSPGFI